MTLEAVRLESPVEGLHASAPEALPFAPEVDIRAFVQHHVRGRSRAGTCSTT